MVAGADTAADLVAELADQLYRVLDRRQRLEKEIERAFFNLHSQEPAGDRTSPRGTHSDRDW